MNHTPGPWVADSWYVGPKELPTLVKVNPNGPVKHEEVTANATLIASAPDMLAALQRCAAILARYPKHDDAWAEARAVIARATGEIA